MKPNHARERTQIVNRFLGRTVVDAQVEIEENNVCFEVTGISLAFDDGSAVKLDAGTYAAPDNLIINWLR